MHYCVFLMSFLFIIQMNAMEVEMKERHDPEEMMKEFELMSVRKEKSLQEVLETEVVICIYYPGSKYRYYSEKVDVKEKGIEIVCSFFQKYYKQRFMCIEPARITELYLSHNQLKKSYFPVFFKNLKKIEYLDFSYNQISELTEDDINSIPYRGFFEDMTIVQIDLRSNCITKIDWPSDTHKNNFELDVSCNFLSDYEQQKITNALKNKWITGPPTIKFGKQRSITQ